jgi:hypothetical protein
MSLEEFKGGRFIRIHEEIYVSESAITDIHFTHRDEIRQGYQQSGASNPTPTGHKILEAEIVTISGEKHYTHDKFAEDLLKLVQARTISN